MADGSPESFALTGMLDLRSGSDTQQRGALRWRQNFRAISKTQIQRRPQFAKYLSSMAYNNEDLHDQLVPLKRAYKTREALRNVLAARDSNGNPFMVAATTSAIYAATPENWQLIGDSFGDGSSDGSGPRFSISVNEDIAIFTNGLDAPQSYAIGAPGAAPSGLCVAPISDLALIGLSAARVTWSWRGITFFADVTMGGQRCPYRIVWSDFENPLSFDPAVVGTLSGTQDLNLFETALAAAPYGNGLLVYTTHGIYSVTPNPGASPTFVFTRLYGYDSDQQSRIGCLKYRNTLVIAGAQHLYIGGGADDADDIYAFNPFFIRPQLADWITQASVKMITDLNGAACDNIVASVRGHEAWFSYPSGSNLLPDTSLVLHTKYSAAEYVDYGFAAFTTAYPNDVESVRQFILENGICEEVALAESGYGYGLEGISELPAAAPAFTPTCIYTNVAKSLGGGVTVEDYTQPQADANSLCALLATLPDPTAACRACDGDGVFVGIGMDSCLKDIGGVWYRETCQNPTAQGNLSAIGYATAQGSYSLEPFDSILRVVHMHGKNPNQDVHATKAELGFEPKMQYPTTVGFRIGQASQEADPNDPTDAIKWNQMTSKAVGILSAMPPPAGFRPANTCQWNFVMSGHFLFLEWTISGTGGDVKMTRASATGEVRDVRNR